MKVPDGLKTSCGAAASMGNGTVFSIPPSQSLFLSTVPSAYPLPRPRLSRARHAAFRLSSILPLRVARIAGGLSLGDWDVAQRIGSVVGGLKV